MQNGKFGVMNALDIVVCQDADDAIAKGYVYRDPVKPIAIEKAVVVKNGMVSGRATVDLLLVTESGEKFVVIVTASLLQSLTMIATANGASHV